jgi:hypothetical protein
MTARRDFYHQQPVWQDLQGAVTGFNPPGIASDPTLETDLALLPGSLLFSPTTENLLVKGLQLSHGHHGSIHSHIHYQRVSAGSGGIIWQMRHRIVGNVAGSMSAWTDWSNLIDVVPVQVPDVHLIAAYQYIDTSLLEDSAIIWFQLRRLPTDPADTYAGNARLLYWDDHIQIVSSGSEVEFPGG